jgi:hypothetical protein
MNIQKEQKTYTVTEQATKWKLTRTVGGVSVAYEVPKETCGTIEELQKYVLDNDIF